MHTFKYIGELKQLFLSLASVHSYAYQSHNFM